MDIVSLIAVVVALLVGLAVGWVIAGRVSAPLRDELERERAERAAAAAAGEDWRDKFNQAVVNLAAERKTAERVEAAEVELRQERERASALAAQVAAFERGEAERQRAHEAQLAQLKELEGKLEGRFGELAGKAVEGAHDLFLKRAEEKFGHAGAQNVERLKSLLQPVETTLKRYEENLTRIEKEREGSYRELNKAVTDLTQSNAVVRTETQRLANVLRSSPKARGRWGEEQLRTILTNAGLAENVDFELQTSVSDGDKQLRPDCVIHMPGNRSIVVDVKCPLVAFEQAYDEEDEVRRAELLLAHANAIKAYASDLGRKSYWRQFEKSPDFVILFVPGEHFLSAAAERAPKLIEDAFNNGVIIASTINMLALAKVMAGMWRQEALAEQAHAIHEIGKELYARLMTMGGHVQKLGKNLSTASEAYNAFVGSLESNVLTQAKRFRDLKVETGGKELESPPIVEFSPRPLVKLSASTGVDPAGEAAE